MTITETDVAHARERYAGDELDELGAAIFAALSAGKTVEYEWTPGDMTRYAIVMYPFASLDAYVPGGARAEESRWRGSVMFALVNFGATFTFPIDGFVHYDYVQEKSQGRIGLGSCIAVEQFLNAITKASQRQT